MLLRMTILYGSVRGERQGIKAARFIKRMVERRGHEARLIDPAEQQLPMLDRTYKEYDKDKAPEAMEYIAEQLRTSDAVIVVSAEYNHGVPPALKNLIDHYMVEYFFKPAGIVTYSAGSFGGVRAAMQLRAILPEVGMPTIPTIFPISKVHDAFNDDGTEPEPLYEKRITRFLDELEWWADACRAQRGKGVPY